MEIPFEFSDTIGGYVTYIDRASGSFGIKTFGGKEFLVKLAPTTSVSFLRNLGEPPVGYDGRLEDVLSVEELLFVYGIFYPNRSGYTFTAQTIYIPVKRGKFRFEEPDWWINQTKRIVDFFIRAQFGGTRSVDYRYYRTLIGLSGEKAKTYRQETDTISRMVYGFATAFMFTGDDLYLEAAEKGVEYLRKHMRFYDIDEDVVYWYHGIDIREDGKEHKVFASEFGDDYDAIPMYEQIYALVGPMQTYRINGDSRIMKDTEMTIKLFNRFFLDRENGGYFSHIDPLTLDPRSDSLGPNRGRKNWNSIGDPAPAYLINLWLTTYNPLYKEMLRYTADCIVEHFPDYANSPFVQERFFEDWRPDKTWGWQQNRAVVGHNLKIVWNLMRVYNLCPEKRYLETAERIAHLMPGVGMDGQRGGWYDVMEREKNSGEDFYRFTWHDRKAWWQQEQAILAYRILYGVLKKSEYLKLARGSAAFYNVFFLDHIDGGIYFNVLNNGIPYLLGTERYKGSHSMSAYHSVELAYLSTIYTNLLHTGQPITLYFKPVLNGFSGGILRVQPDILPPASARLSQVWIDGKPWTRFDPEGFEIGLPKFNHRPKIKVKIMPVL